jgi:hypothetical protein
LEQSDLGIGLWRTRSMLELALIIGSFSAGIFLAHAIEAYHGQ